MIDLHCHIIDGIGCGPDSFAESLEMSRLAAEEGVHTVVATPKWKATSFEPPLSLAECQRRLDKLRDEMREKLSFRLGFMMEFRTDLPLLLDSKGTSIALGGGRYILVSLPPFEAPPAADLVWEHLSRRGFSVVLARPECNLALRRNPSRLESWVERGVMLQIDAASINGAHGREIQLFVWQYIQKYERSVIVSSNARNSDLRRNSLACARESLVKELGAHRAGALLHETPKLILGSTPKPSRRVPASRISQNLFLQLFRWKRKAFETT